MSSLDNRLTVKPAPGSGSLMSCVIGERYLAV